MHNKSFINQESEHDGRCRVALAMKEIDNPVPVATLHSTLSDAKLDEKITEAEATSQSESQLSPNHDKTNKDLT